MSENDIQPQEMSLFEAVINKEPSKTVLGETVSFSFITGKRPDTQTPAPFLVTPIPVGFKVISLGGLDISGNSSLPIPADLIQGITDQSGKNYLIGLDAWNNGVLYPIPDISTDHSDQVRDAMATSLVVWEAALMGDQK